MAEDIASINSEMRYITLELMKIAIRRKKSFKSVANEFVSNVYGLESVVDRRGRASPKRSRKPAHVQHRHR